MFFLFNSFIYNPLYNALVFLIDVLPGHDVGLAVVVLTVLVKLILFPLAKKATLAQRAMSNLEGEISKVKEKYSDKKEQAMKTMELYKERGVNPFAGILTIIVQIPIIIALYLVFARAGLPEIMSDLLYPFVSTPEQINMIFLGLVDMAGKSWPLAVLAGLSQFLYAQVSTPAPSPKTSATPNFKEDFARSMQIQIRYVLPVAVLFIAHSFSAAVALYWSVGNIFGIAQEFVVRRHIGARGFSSSSRT